jgi:glycosyltransferase involved in cell wall biosynthesis
MDKRKKKIVILGSAHPLRGGGISTFNERLAQALQENGCEVKIFSFSLQYPALFFPGKSQFTKEPAPTNLTIHSIVNSINPFNWLKVGKILKNKCPDLIIVRYWTPFMSPCFGTILRKVKKNKQTKIICIADNIIPHEKHFFDTFLTKYFVKPIDAFFAMSKDVLKDVQKLASKPAFFTPHPIYDNYGKKLERNEALQKLGLEDNYIYFLFFGFIRSYKGLDLLIDAFADARLREFPVKLIVAGEFYENSTPYLDAIQKYNLSNDIILRTNFIPNEEIKNYFSAADLIVQPYKSATQSGVTQIGYHFEKPMLVTNVGGLAEIIPNGKVGYVVEPIKEEITTALLDFLKNKPDFLQEIQEEKQKYTWDKLVTVINSVYEELI